MNIRKSITTLAAAGLPAGGLTTLTTGTAQAA
jgi:hypothetical protein